MMFINLIDHLKQANPKLNKEELKALEKQYLQHGWTKIIKIP